MKRIFILFIASNILLLATCKDNKKDENGNNNKVMLSLTPISLDFAANAVENQTITVETNAKSWNITQSVDWLIIDKKADSFTVTVEKTRKQIFG